jgi:hypothetical protein
MLHYFVERRVGIEPLLPAGMPDVQPLHFHRFTLFGIVGWPAEY